nr:MAG TPA: hypothetical protein [Caudoviricetes sp.]
MVGTTPEHHLPPPSPAIPSQVSQSLCPHLSIKNRYLCNSIKTT